jgi:predicted TIM-barrel fold metal-dependent hydrolase
MTGTIGAPLGKPGYRLIDADAHINEPPDLWVSRVPSEFRDRAPRMEHFERGDAWVMEGAPDPINFGLNAAAGLPVEERRPWARFEDIRAGGYDPKARLQEMDSDLVDACVLYPTPRLSHLLFATRDPALHLALVRAYNDWLAEYCSSDPGRLGGIALVPNRGVTDARAEVERTVEQPGIVGVLIGCFPHGDLDLAEEDDVVWRAVADAGVPLHIHVGLVNEMPKDIYAAGTVTEGHAQGDMRFLQAPVRMVQFVNGKVFDRVPDLQVVLAEVDAGWVPYVKEQLDNRLLRRTPGGDARVQRLPSDIIDEHFAYTYITDHFAIRNRQAVGVERLMWSSDYPHSGSDWPNSVRVIHADFAGVPASERDLILAGNALRLYRFDERA